MDLISRQAAIDAVRGRFSMPVDNLIVEVISNLPSAQPEIIHCKDCEYYETMYCKMDVWTDDMRIYKAKPNDYCSYAVRKEDV